jgi:hypothetical protein
LSQSLIDNRKIEIFKASALSGAFAYRHLSGALLLVRNASAMSPVGPDSDMAVAAMLSIPFRGGGVGLPRFLPTFGGAH